MLVNILGTEYRIDFRLLKDDTDLKDLGGYCDNHARTIVIRKYTDDERNEDNMSDDLDEYNKEVLRHEIIHAFLFESGLSDSSMQYNGAWAKCEEMVDWIAIQFPKILKVFKETNCI